MESDRAANQVDGQVVVTSGHMIDAPDRPHPRFPPPAEPRVTRAIRAVLDGWRLGPGDLVITQGARGTDLIVAEQALDCGAQVAVLLAREPEAFKAGSVELPETGWARRFDDVRARAQRVAVLPRADLAEKPYARTNRWALDEAVAAARAAKFREHRSHPYSVVKKGFWIPRHSALGMISPVKFEYRFTQTAQAA